MTWIANAHQVEASATGTPDVSKLMKEGEQVGSIMVNLDDADPSRGTVALPVFKYTLYIAGIDEEYFRTNGTLTIDDDFDEKNWVLLDVGPHTSRGRNAADGVTNKRVLTDTTQRDALNINRWDQALKGYGKTNNWVGPTQIAISDLKDSNNEVTGVTFTVTKDDFLDNGLDPKVETTEGSKACLRYSINYYLVVKDAETAQRLALECNTPDENATPGVEKKIIVNNSAYWGQKNINSEVDAELDFKPLSKSLDYDDVNDIAYYTVVINPQRLTLNKGGMIRVEDSYENMAVDFESVATGITTVPEDRARLVDWAFHSNVGTFWVPDETMVTIKYKAQPIGEAGKKVTLKNTLKMMDYQPLVVEEEFRLNTEAAGSAGDYNIRLFKYADNSMNIPLVGAVFQLLEENAMGNKVPVKYLTTYNIATDTSRPGETDIDRAINTSLGYDYPTNDTHQAGDAVYYTTHNDGFADIHLRQDKDGLVLERGKQYYLWEVEEPYGYTKEDIDWSFIIDDMDYFDTENGVWVYRDNGVLTVSNSSKDDKGLVLRKDFFGDPITWAVQKDIAFEIKVEDITDLNNVKTLIRRELTYNDFVRDFSDNATASGYRIKMRPDELPHEDGKRYRFTITESNADTVTHTRQTAIDTWIGDDSTTRTTQVSAATAAKVSASVEVTGEDIAMETPIRFYFENTYTAKPVNLQVTKAWSAENTTGKTNKSFRVERQGGEYDHRASRL